MLFEYVEIYFLDIKNMNACHLGMMKFILCILIFKSLNNFGIEETPLEWKQTFFFILDLYMWNTSNHQSSSIIFCEFGEVESQRVCEL